MSTRENIRLIARATYAGELSYFMIFFSFCWSDKFLKMCLLGFKYAIFISGGLVLHA